jgi:asparagine synthase (glutamine-hydrolysing)
MKAVLTHRGSGATTAARFEDGAVGHLAQYSEVPEPKTTAGVRSDGDITLALAGHVVGPLSSREEMLCEYRSHGIGFVESLRGAFVLFLRDGEDTYLVRDGSGVRTVYYGMHEGRLHFAVEPKAVLATPGFPRRLRPASVAQYLTFSFIPGPTTMLEDLYEVPAGHYLHFRSGRAPTLHRYFHFEREEALNDEPDEHWVEQFAQTFRSAVAEVLPRDERVGIFLSGGVDSSVVTAEVARQHPIKPLTYAIHFGEKYDHELDFARAVAERCGTEHTEVEIKPKNFLPRMRKIIWHLDDPIGDPITVPNFEIAQRARQDVRWVYNGEGGDPCFGGPKNLYMMLHHWYGGIDRGPGFRERMYLRSYRRAYEEVARLLAPGMLEKISHEQDLEGVLTPFFETEKPSLLLNKLMAINIRLKGAHLILPKVDRMMGASGLTPFAPLFDERIVKLSFAMPGTMKVRGGIEKWVIKRAYEDLLPASVIERPKSGMRVPVHFWFRREMKRYARKILSPKNVRRVGIFDPDRVKQLLDYNITEGQGRYGLRLWMLITFEMWRRIVIEGEAV